MEELGYAVLFVYGLVFFTLVGIVLLTVAIFGLRLKRLSGKIVFAIGIIFLLPLGGYAVTIIHGHRGVPVGAGLKYPQKKAVKEC